MKRIVTLILLLSFWLVACGPSALATPSVHEDALSTPTAPATETSAPPTSTPTRVPSVTPPAPTLTETLLPTLELTTLEAFEPALDVWDGQPTYLADSQPGFFFRVKFNPRVWGLTEDSYGQPALGHREIEYCIIAPVGPRGMAPGMQVEHDTRKIGTLFFEVNVVLSQGVRQFVTYQATDKVIFTGFQVNFVDEIDACLADAESVLATLTSIPESQATPIP
ncbi:MAG: hypothetical protein C4583_09145 [Anaerolineaceae bacterium]|nr:MAG: hypothetical protein C4583_09145 [Anaerolineaceae bacterium]